MTEPSSSKTRLKRRGIPLGCLGRPALLQLQAQGIDVSKYLNAKPGEKLTGRQPLRVHKFNVSDAEIRTEDGIVFASKLEAAAYRYLRDHHVPFDRQTEFVIEEGFEHEGKKYRAVKYVCDFVIDPGGKKLVVDTKGFRTRMFELKQKLVLKRFGIKIICIRDLPSLALLLRNQNLQ